MHVIFLYHILYFCVFARYCGAKVTLVKPYSLSTSAVLSGLESFGRRGSLACRSAGQPMLRSTSHRQWPFMSTVLREHRKRYPVYVCSCVCVFASVCVFISASYSLCVPLCLYLLLRSAVYVCLFELVPNPHCPSPLSF